MISQFLTHDSVSNILSVVKSNWISYHLSVCHTIPDWAVNKNKVSAVGALIGIRIIISWQWGFRQ